MNFKKAFTLIELMIVISILGILASLAIPAYIHFMNRSKLSELPVTMGALAKAEMGYIQRPRIDRASGDELYRCWQLPFNFHPQRNPLGLPCGTTSRKVGWFEDFGPWAAFNIIGFSSASPLYLTYSMDQNPDPLGPPMGGNGDGYCEDSDIVSGFQSLSNEPLRILAHGNFDDDTVCSRFSLIINTQNGVPSSSSLMTFDELE